MSDLSLVTGKPREGWSVPTKDNYFVRAALWAERNRDDRARRSGNLASLPLGREEFEGCATFSRCLVRRLSSSSPYRQFTLLLSMLLSNRWLTAKWPTPRKAAGTAAERDGSTAGRVVVNGAITGDGGEVRRHGHQRGGTGESTAGGSFGASTTQSCPAWRDA
jgi:hypothetical protein